MNQLFYLDDLEIDEPVGFADIELSIKRDETFHGMTYEASTSSLQFYGTAATYLMNKKETEGVKANVEFRAMISCDYDYEELISGRLNFGKYKESCGTECFVSLPLEQQSCAIIFHSRKDQKIDIDKETAVNNVSPLANYLGLAVDTELPSHNLKAEIDANVSAEGYAVPTIETGLQGDETYAFRPLYTVKRYDSIETSNIDNGTDAAVLSGGAFLPGAISPQLLFENKGACYDGTFDYNFRLKGNLNLNIFDGSAIVDNWIIRLAKGEWPSPITDIAVFDLGAGLGGDFDVTFSGTTTLSEGQGLYMIEQIRILGDGGDVNMFIEATFDPESSVLITATKTCPATNAELYLIHETLSRVSESITNGCLRVKSSFYGRTDSEPFSFETDGCGGLRTVTSGLKIRRAEEDKFFVSMKDLLEGLNAIDNIGFDIIEDPDIEGNSLLRIESVDYFYQDKEILRHDGIPKADTETEESKHYSRIDVGYKKWEVENVNGLDEFNSNRQYSTSIDTINSNLDITSNLVAGSYPIEITRQQSFADSGGADTKYDNEIFIISMFQSGYPYAYPYAYLQVEQGNVTGAENIFSPSTIYNYRLSPIRNLMRWYKSIAAGFSSLADAANKLFFSSGTGNLIAKGLMTDTDCRQENMAMRENDNVFVTQFTNQADYTPLWKPELKTYEYPMSIADYRAVKADPYGYISAQCGTGDFLKYWIKEIKFKPMKGSATFVLRRKYGN